MTSGQRSIILFDYALEIVAPSFPHLLPFLSDLIGIDSPLLCDCRSLLHLKSKIRKDYLVPSTPHLPPHLEVETSPRFFLLRI